MPSLAQDLAFANRIKEGLPDCRVFVFGTVIMATLDLWIRDTKVYYILYGEPEACFERILAAEDPGSVRESSMRKRTFRSTGTTSTTNRK